MKNVLFAVLVFCSVHLNAQQVQYYNLPADYYGLAQPVSRTEAVFSKPGNMFRHKLQIALPQKAMIDINLMHMDHLPAVMQLDSVLYAVWQMLQPLKDSFPSDLNNRLVDVSLPPDGLYKFRISTFAPRGNSFVLQKEGMAPLKIEQDTLNITGFVSSTIGSIKRLQPWNIQVRINNLSELPTLLNGNLHLYMKQMAEDYAQLTHYNAKKKYNAQAVKLLYNPLATGEKRSKYTVFRTPRYKMRFQVAAQPGIQNVRTSLAPSVGVGIAFSDITYWHYGKEFALLWEPFFFFGKNSAGNTVIDRNDFVVFQHTVQFGRIGSVKDLAVTNTLSIGYLVGRRGDYFNRHTVKFGLPGMAFRNAQLLPQFIFNDFFKQCYPSLKLQVKID